MNQTGWPVQIFHGPTNGPQLGALFASQIAAKGAARLTLTDLGDDYMEDWVRLSSMMLLDVFWRATLGEKVLVFPLGVGGTGLGSGSWLGIGLGLGDAWREGARLPPTVTYGCRPHHLRLQPVSPTVAARITYGCSPHHLRLQPVRRLQPASPTVAGAGLPAGHDHVPRRHAAHGRLSSVRLCRPADGRRLVDDIGPRQPVGRGVRRLLTARPCQVNPHVQHPGVHHACRGQARGPATRCVLVRVRVRVRARGPATRCVLEAP